LRFIFLIIFLWNIPDASQFNALPWSLKYYQGKYIIVKISGEFIDGASKDLEAFCQYIESLVSYDITPILCIGWGKQISRYWNTQFPDTPRPKWKDGGNYTTKELIKYGVQPAYDEIREILEKKFSPSAIHFSEITDCSKVESLGEVGIPWETKKSFEKGKIHIVPFLWKDINGEPVNINADDIAKNIGQQIWEELAKIFFITETWGILDNHWEIYSIITKESIKQILDGKHKRVTVDGGMKKKIEAINDLLISWIHSIVLTHMRHFKQEIESIFWKGSYIVDEDYKTIQEWLDINIFRSIFEEEVAKWNWKTRSEDEIQELAKNHKTVLVNGLPIGWLSLREITINWETGQLIECLWSAEEWIGLGRKIIKYITWNIGIVFAYSKNVIFFEKAGFSVVPGITSATWALCFRKP
jgi:acetylglutamate kinase